MCTLKRFTAFLTLVTALSQASNAQIEPPFPDSLTQWVQDPKEAIFQGAGGDAWDAKIRERGWILRVGDEFRLYYTGYNDTLSPTRFLGLATSKDCVHWERHPANPLFTKTWVEDMCVLKVNDGYVMFAEGLNDIAHLLKSTDGIQWNEVGPLDIRRVDGAPIAPGPYGTPTVWIEDGTYYLFYERGDQGVWLATSTDLKTWTNRSDDPVIPMGPDPYDQAAVAVNQIINQGDWYYAVYHANSQRPWKEWTTCIARSKDLVHWEKHPGNPIVSNNSSSGLFVTTPDGLKLYTMHPEVRRYINRQRQSQPQPASR
jgi:beta-1,2-mannobiose phosphorylase / 1,2-beta-oligomannan phosphorylase